MEQRDWRSLSRTSQVGVAICDQQIARFIMARRSAFTMLFVTIDRMSQAAPIDCDDFQSAERLIAIALSGHPVTEIATELKDLFVHQSF